MKNTETANRIAEMIRRNVDLWYADVTSFERFSKRNGVLWQIAQNRGLDESVLDIVRPPMSALPKELR